MTLVRKLLRRRYAPVMALGVLALAVLGVLAIQSGTGGSLLGTAAVTHKLTVTINGTGQVIGMPVNPNYPIVCNNNAGLCTGNIPQGTVVGLMAMPAPTLGGISAVAWNGCTTASGSNCTVTMTAAKTIDATFTPPYVTSLSVTTAAQWQNASCGSSQSVGKDMNEGAGGDWVSVCYDVGTSGDSILILEAVMEDDSCGTLFHDKKVAGNLNEKADPVTTSNKIYLCTTTAPRQSGKSFDMLKALSFGSRPAAGAECSQFGAGWAAVQWKSIADPTNRDTPFGGAAEFNKGAGGQYMYLCRHLLP